jgi:hypothetical protein
VAALRAAAVIVLPGIVVHLLLVASVAGALLYWLAFRPRLARWGAVREELSIELPGDERVAAPRISSTRSVTIDAPPGGVWPWLVQLGQGRGGFYSYDFLENLAGLEIHSADRVVTELQRLEVGDLVRSAPQRFGPDAGFRVAGIEPGRALILSVGEAPVSWALVVRGLSGGRTRLLSRWRIGGGRRVAVAYGVAVELQHFIMERRMLLGIAARAERAAAASA